MYFVRVRYYTKDYRIAQSRAIVSPTGRRRLYLHDYRGALLLITRITILS